MTRSLLEQITVTVADHDAEPLNIHIDIWDSSLARRWLAHLNTVLAQGLHLEKNYAWLGWATSDRNGDMIMAELARSIEAINAADLGYQIDTVPDAEVAAAGARGVNAEFWNHIHRHFELLQGHAGHMSNYYTRADRATRWHIRQLNLLCHEYESWALSWHKLHTAPEWQRPSLLMCWLNAPRFELEPEDLDLFGIDTINRELGGVYVGVNKAVGKHHWEVFSDEGRDSRVGELTTTHLAPQTQACADFDIEWGQDPGAYVWQQQRMCEFRAWLTANGWDPEDPALTLGHPQIGRVDLIRSFGTVSAAQVWAQLNTRLNVVAVGTTTARAEYPYHWRDQDYAQQQQKELK